MLSRYAVIVAAAVSLSCKGPVEPPGSTEPVDPAHRGPLGPSGSTDALAADTQPHIAASEADAISSHQEVKTRKIGIVQGSVRITNTSGGKVLVVDRRSREKPVIVHFRLEEWTDMKNMALEGVCLGARPVVYRNGEIDDWYFSDAFDTGGTGGGGIGSKCLRSEDFVGGMGRIHWRPRIRYGTGQWREHYMTVQFYLFYDDSDWSVVRPLHSGIRVELTAPHPSNIVFHPVVADSTQLEQEIDWIQDTINGDGSHDHGILADILKYTPFVIGELTVGEPVIIDTTTAGYRQGSFSCRPRTPGCFAIFAMEYSEWRRNIHSTMDFHVAIVAPETFNGDADGAGYAQVGSQFIGIHWNDNTHSMNGALVHEMGHALGMEHVLCRSDAVWHDPNYPVISGNINVDGYRIDPWGNVVVVPTSEYYDVMSYCRPYWVSAYTYRRIAEYRFGIEPTLAATRRTIPDPVIHEDNW